MSRALCIGAGLGLALFILTCTDRGVTGPRRPALATLNFSSFAGQQAGEPPVPIDSLEITLKRLADQSIAFDTILGFRPDTVVADSALVQLNVNLTQNTEQDSLIVRAFGAGSDWYRATGTVQLSAGTAVPVTPLVRYVGPGYNAKSITVAPVDTIAVGGTVTWSWAGGSHSVQSTGSPSFTSSGIMMSGNYSHTFTTAGVYRYDCAVHSSLMTGTIVVR